MEAAPEKLQSVQVLHVEVIYNCAMGKCVPRCNGTWLEYANQVLSQNNVCAIDLQKVCENCLRNIMIVAPFGCAKTFLLKPLSLMHKTFNNPANEMYAIGRAVDAEIMFLNNFRWDKETITGQNLLNLLEGEPVHIPSPKNHFKTDAVITKDTPIFATGKSVITYKAAYNARDPVEDEMMAVRWNVYKFTYQIPDKDQKDILACPKCFAQMVLN